MSLIASWSLCACFVRSPANSSKFRIPAPNVSNTPSYRIRGNPYEQTYQELREIQKELDLAVLDESSLGQVPYPPASLRVAEWVSSPPTSSREIDYLEDIVVETIPPPSSGLWDHARVLPKIKNACAVARRYGYRLLWIDSCCIDKTSSAELSEAINSMYPWYRDADICFAYLADVSNGDYPYSRSSKFRRCCWFRRGWTLQELLAPLVVMFLSGDWNFYGTVWKLADVIEEVTGIEIPVLTHQKALRDVCVATRMSWASRRVTTRVEDRAYSLLGIFDITMPTLYGEGERAFLRLQEEILRRIPDQSLFAWGYQRSQEIASNLCLDWSTYEHETSILAASPSEFSASWSIRPVPHDEFRTCIGLPDLPHPTFSATPFGLRTQFPLIKVNDDDDCLAVLACEMEGRLLVFPCRVDGHSQIRRLRPLWSEAPFSSLSIEDLHREPKRITVPMAYADVGWMRREAPDSVYVPKTGVPMIRMRRMDLLEGSQNDYKISSRLVPYDEFIVSLAHDDGREIAEIHFKPQSVGTAIPAAIECAGQYLSVDHTRSFQVALDPSSHGRIQLCSESEEDLVIIVTFHWSRACWCVEFVVKTNDEIESIASRDNSVMGAIIPDRIESDHSHSQSEPQNAGRMPAAAKMGTTKLRRFYRSLVSRLP